jgi:hypothetical protein
MTAQITFKQYVAEKRGAGLGAEQILDVMGSELRSFGVTEKGADLMSFGLNIAGRLTSERDHQWRTRVPVSALELPGRALFCLPRGQQY